MCSDGGKGFASRGAASALSETWRVRSFLLVGGDASSEKKRYAKPFPSSELI
jgi:hypothetical protein